MNVALAMVLPAFCWCKLSPNAKTKTIPIFYDNSLSFFPFFVFVGNFAQKKKKNGGC
jgi:hypothetical protein